MRKQGHTHTHAHAHVHTRTHTHTHTLAPPPPPKQTWKYVRAMVMKAVTMIRMMYTMNRMDQMMYTYMKGKS